MNNKAFTLVELLVAVAILAIMTMISIPVLRAFQNNNYNKQFISYKKSLEDSAKLYVDSYGTDLFGEIENGCQVVNLEELMTKKVAKDISLKDVSCNNLGKDSKVMIRKINDEYTYKSFANCENSSGVNVYSDVDSQVGDCINDNGMPEILVSTNSDTSNTTKKKSVIISLKDYYGFTQGQKIKYAWSKKEEATELADSDYTLYSYNNNYKKAKDVDGVLIDSKSITMKDNLSGNFYLYVKPVKVQNILNNSLDTIKRFGPFRFDSDPPKCPTFSAVDIKGNSVEENKSVQGLKINIDFSDEDLQDYELRVKYDNGSWSNIETRNASDIQFVPALDGKVKISVRGRDYANNKRDEWCNSPTYINDNTAPSTPKVTGYLKKNGDNISNSKGLSKHGSDIWINKWILTVATSSVDNIDKSVTYYVSATGTTAHATDLVQSYRNVNAQGSSTVSYKACDAAGNCSKKVNYVAKLDREPPTFTYEFGCIGNYQKHIPAINHKYLCSKVVAYVKYKDNLSGVAKRTFWVGDNRNKLVSDGERNAPGYDFPGTGNNQIAFKITSLKDFAGNSATKDMGIDTIYESTKMECTRLSVILDRNENCING